MLFQQNHSLHRDEFTLVRGRCFNYLSHFHSAFELYIQIEGKTIVTVDDTQYYLSPGQAVLIFPYQNHSYSYKKGERGSYCMGIFSPFLVSNFGKFDMVPTDNRFDFNLPEKIDISNSFLRQALAYSICGSFDKGRQYKKRYNHILSEGLVAVILYANENFRTECTLQKAVSHVGYDYGYISKLFKKSVGVTFNQYVNFLRIQHGLTLLKITNTSVTQIALDSGYTNLRTFNRRFFEQMGVTPNEFRKGIEKPLSPER